MKILLILLFFLSSVLAVFAKTQHAYIEVENKQLEGEVTSKLFGSFLEFVHHWINSPVGLSAQELINRGFDIENYGYGIAPGWEIESVGTASFVVRPGGYNPNGKYYQEVNNESEGLVGIKQTVYLDPDMSQLFYVYLQSSSDCGPISLSMINHVDSSVIFQADLGTPNKEWQKFEIIVPPLKSVHKARLLLSFSGIGTVNFDEASLVGQDCKFGIRKEYYDFYKEWSPGIIRYPGGYFADTKLADWKYGIGDIDLRESANFDGKVSARFEIGTDEFISFCRDIGAEPHLVVNLKNGSADHAADWVEYCNGENDTEYGLKRSENGYDAPHNVKYWEIGNEQWENPGLMSERFSEFARKMLEVDENLYLFIDGYFSQGLPFFLKSMEKAHSYVNNYGWHFSWKVDEAVLDNNTEIYLSMIGNTKVFENFLYDVEKWIGEYYPASGIMQSVTEAWIFYNNWDWYANPRLFTMENGIWTAIINNMAVRHSATCNIMERTHNSGCFYTDIDEVTGEKTIAPAPAYYACLLQRQHTGDRVLSTNYSCPEFSVGEVKGSYPVEDVPWLDVTSTISSDSIFVSIVNKHPRDTFQIDLDLDKFDINSNAVQYILAGDSILAGPSMNNKQGVTPYQKEFVNLSGIRVLPLSLTILAIPYDGVQHVDSNGINQIEAILSPNPFHDFVTIEFSQPVREYSTLSIYTPAGRILYMEELKHGSSKTTLNLQGFSDGPYFVVLKTLTNYSTSLVIKCN